MKLHELEFRIRHASFKENKRWGYFLINEIGELNRTMDTDKLNYQLWCGYKDTAMIKMYEGDIIKWIEMRVDRVGEVKYVKERNKNGFYVVSNTKIYTPLNEFFVDTCNPLIIGNIIDNLHLLSKH